MTGTRIFINYRRSDSAGWARQLHGDLQARFGARCVFRDVAIEPGVDFIEHIERVMDASEVCIVVIGPRWATATNGDGRRLDDPDDLVRGEIERALQRTDVVVIPVLVDGATMPSERELPDGLRTLARRNACELSDSRWDYDIEVLCRRLRRVLGEPTPDTGRRLVAPESDSVPGDAPAKGTLVPVLATLAAAGGGGVLAAVLSKPLAGRGEPVWGRLAGYAIERGVIWAIIGAVVAGAAAATFGRVRVPLGAALVGAGAGWLGGAAGGAAYMAMKHFAGISEQEAQWLLLFALLVPPAMLLAAALARVAGARADECALAAVAGAVVAALVTGDNRTLLVTLGAVLVAGAITAVLAAPPHRGLVPRREPASRGAATS